MNCGYCDGLFPTNQEGYILLLIHQAIVHGEQELRGQERPYIKENF